MPGVTVTSNRAYCKPGIGHTRVGQIGTYVYIVFVSSSLSLLSSQSSVQHRHAWIATVSINSIHANAQLLGSTSHCARNTSPHTHSKAAMFLTLVGNAIRPSTAQATTSRCIPCRMPRLSPIGIIATYCVDVHRYATSISIAVTPSQTKHQCHRKEQCPPLTISLPLTCSKHS